MTTKDLLIQTIRDERQCKRGYSPDSLLEHVRQGNEIQAVEELIYFSDPGKFHNGFESCLATLSAELPTWEPEAQQHGLNFLAELYLSLCSFLPHWNLQNQTWYGAQALSAEQIAVYAGSVRACIAGLEPAAPLAVLNLLDDWRAYNAARLQAEQAPDPQAQAAALVGDTVCHYLDHMESSLQRSHLRRIAEMRLAGETATEISNDYAAFLPYTLYLGASFQTTNPPLVNLAWSAEPERWNPVVDALIAAHPGLPAADLARLLTLEVVLSQMRRLRPLFLLSEGQMGCVCLQVNPENHADPDAMLADALFFYEQLKERLGGVPNVVFKLPGTYAALQVCKELTGRGIGVVITVDFAMFQHLPFLETMLAGQDIFSSLVEMNGRLAFPVRDELLAKLDELAAFDIDERLARQAAAWAGVIIARRLQRLMKSRGLDTRRVRPLIASLRIYQGTGYEQLPSAFPDITEDLGISLISVFPNIRYAFDNQPTMPLHPRPIDEPVDAQIMAVLAHSELFKQAYYIADRQWSPDEDERFRPQEIIQLSDQEKVLAWKPIHATLTEFIKSYQTTIQRIQERQQTAQS